MAASSGSYFGTAPKAGARNVLARKVQLLRPHQLLNSYYYNTVIFKVAFSTFKFIFGATLRRQAEWSDSESRHKAPNLT